MEEWGMNAREALAELVAVKDLKDSIEPAMKTIFIGTKVHTEESNRLRAEYLRRQPLAWAAARAVLAMPET